MKNTNSIFYSGIDYLPNSRLRYKFPRNKCATLIDKSSFEIIKKYRSDKALSKSEIEHKDMSRRSGGAVFSY